MNTTELLKKLKIKVNNEKLIDNAFVHRSYLNEAKEPGLESNERLEFLGDAVMELIVTEHLYNNYQEPEGVLTSWRAALVKGEMISKVADSLGFNELLKLSKGEQDSTGKARGLILANTFEAFLGALYLDQGYAVVSDFLHKHLICQLGSILEQKLHLDPKSQLQELLQSKQGITPTYILVTEDGPDHAKEFTIQVKAGTKVLAEGTGQSKQKAEAAAARNALKDLEAKV